VKGSATKPTTADAPPADVLNQDSALARAEQELARKYRGISLVHGSLRPGGPEGFGTKRILDIACADCGGKRTIATSDLFHCDGRCAPCSKVAKKSARKKGR
jgi:hypothetical protein